MLSALFQPGANRISSMPLNVIAGANAGGRENISVPHPGGNGSVYDAVRSAFLAFVFEFWLHDKREINIKRANNLFIIFN